MHESDLVNWIPPRFYSFKDPTAWHQRSYRPVSFRRSPYLSASPISSPLLSSPSHFNPLHSPTGRSSSPSTFFVHVLLLHLLHSTIPPLWHPTRGSNQQGWPPIRRFCSSQGSAQSYSGSEDEVGYEADATDVTDTPDADFDDASEGDGRSGLAPR